MSSWVDSGLDAASRTRPPPAVTRRTRPAVSAVTFRQAATVRPPNGCWPETASVSSRRTGMARRAHSILGRPAMASPGSRMSDTAGPVTGSSVAVVIGLERAIDRDADVGGLLLGQGGQPDAQRVEVQAGHLLVQVLGQHVHAERVVGGLGGE